MPRARTYGRVVDARTFTNKKAYSRQATKILF